MRSTRTPGNAARLMALCASAFLLSACSDSAGPDPIVTGLTIDPAGAAISGLGAAVQFAAMAVDENGGTTPATHVTWWSLTPSLGTVDPTSGVTTAVSSGQVTVMAEALGGVAYALLTVSVPDVAPVTSWHPTDLGFPITDVWGTSPDNVYAVGGGTAGARISHYDGTAWSSMDVAGADQTLWSIRGTSAFDIFAVGDSGTVLHYDGASWSLMDSGVTGGLTGVWAAAPDAVFAVGAPGALFYDGEAWTPMSEVAGAPWWVWGTSVDNVHFHAEDVTRGVWGSAPDDIFAVGRAGKIWHYDGQAWTEMDSGTDVYLLGVWGTSPGDVYAVGDAGTILHYDGTAWSPMTSGTDLDLWQIWGFSSGEVFVVSRLGLVLRGVR